MVMLHPISPNGGFRINDLDTASNLERLVTKNADCPKFWGLQAIMA
jgi:hypothetical protein